MPWKIVFFSFFLMQYFIDYLRVSRNAPWSHSIPSLPRSPLPQRKEDKRKKERKEKLPSLICVAHILAWSVVDFPKASPLKKAESFHTHAPGKALGFFNCLSHLWSRRAAQLSPGQARKPQSRLQLFLALAWDVRGVSLFSHSVSFSPDPIYSRKRKVNLIRYL